MRAPNFYSHPGFERAGLRRRDTGWIVERVGDPGSLFIPVWRNQNLVHAAAEAPRAALLLPHEVAREAGETVLLGVDDTGAFFALDLSAHDEPLTTIRAGRGTSHCSVGGSERA